MRPIDEAGYIEEVHQQGVNRSDLRDYIGAAKLFAAAQSLVEEAYNGNPAAALLHSARIWESRGLTLVRKATESDIDVARALFPEAFEVLGLAQNTVSRLTFQYDFEQDSERQIHDVHAGIVNSLGRTTVASAVKKHTPNSIAERREVECSISMFKRAFRLSQSGSRQNHALIGWAAARSLKVAHADEILHNGGVSVLKQVLRASTSDSKGEFISNLLEALTVDLQSYESARRSILANP